MSRARATAWRTPVSLETDCAIGAEANADNAGAACRDMGRLARSVQVGMVEDEVTNKRTESEERKCKTCLNWTDVDDLEQGRSEMIDVNVGDVPEGFRACERAPELPLIQLSGGSTEAMKAWGGEWIHWTAGAEAGGLKRKETRHLTSSGPRVILGRDVRRLHACQRIVKTVLESTPCNRIRLQLHAV
jgi:hypothetical protein